MSVMHRIPALCLMVLCHVVVVYHMLERRYGKWEFIAIIFAYTVYVPPVLF